MFHRRTLGFILLLSGLCLILGFNYIFRPFEQQLPETLNPSPSPVAVESNPALQWTPEAAVAEILAMPIQVSNTASPSAQYLADLGWISNRHPGIVTLFGTNISTTSAQTAISQIKAQYPESPALIAVDHEGGTVQRLSGTGFTRLPSWQTLCTQPASSSAQVLNTSAAELQKVGVNIVLAPVIDVRNSSAVLGSRLCSDDASLVAEKAVEYIQAFSSHQILPTLKHFPGIGGATRDLHVAFDKVTVTPEEAALYRELLNDFPFLAVLVSHVGVINQFADIPCSLSHDCIAELEKNYPQVLVISDALEMDSAGHQLAETTPASTRSAQLGEPLTLTERAIKAIEAGNHVLLFGNQVSTEEMEEVYQAVLAESYRNPSFRALVETAATRVRQLKK